VDKKAEPEQVINTTKFKEEQTAKPLINFFKRLFEN